MPLDRGNFIPANSYSLAHLFQEAFQLLAEQRLLFDMRQVPDVGYNDHPGVRQPKGELGGHAWRIDQIELAHEDKAGYVNPLDPGPGIVLGRGPGLPGKGLWILRPGVLFGKSNQALDLALVVIECRRDQPGQRGSCEQTNRDLATKQDPRLDQGPSPLVSPRVG